MLTNSSSSSTDQLIYYCSRSPFRLYISFGVMAAKTLLVLPLSIFVLYLGHGRWRQQRSFKTASHSDVFTLHLAVNELFWGLGVVCYIYSMYREDVGLMMVGLCSLSVTFFGEVFFHLLTCVERYLAVVHPVAYLTLKNARGVRIRNVGVGCAWLLCFGLISFHADLTSNSISFAMLFVLVASIVVMTFCSLSVLWVLTRPGPGEGGRVDQSKLRAFHTITAISSVLWLWFAGLLAAIASTKLSELSEDVQCLVISSVGWFNLPTSLVSPLLYLHRAGRLSCGSLNPE